MDAASLMVDEWIEGEWVMGGGEFDQCSGGRVVGGAVVASW